MMKKWIALLLALTLCLSLFACGTEPPVEELPEVQPETEVEPPVEEEPVDVIPPLVPGETHTIENYGQLTLVRVVTSDKLQASLNGGQYYTRNAEGEVFLDMVFDVVNDTAEPIQTQKFLTATAVSADGTEYVCNIFGTETNEMADFSLFGELTPGAATRYHAAVSIPAAKTEFTLNILADGTAFTCQYSSASDLHESNELTAGAKLTAEGFAEAEFLGWEFADAVYPTETVGAYQFFRASEDGSRIYLVLKFLVTSQLEEAKAVSSFVGARASIGSDKYEAMTISEDDDLQGLSSMNQLTPQNSTKVYCLFEVPSEAAEQSFEAVVTFRGQEYIVAG